jgi:hypothetical protein
LLPRALLSGPSKGPAILRMEMAPMSLTSILNGREREQLPFSGVHVYRTLLLEMTFPGGRRWFYSLCFRSLTFSVIDP